MLQPLLQPAARAANDRLRGTAPILLPAPPVLDLDFVGRPSLQYPGLPPITFTRASAATRVNAAGVIEAVGADTPRFDHDPATGARLGLLIEEARTNLILRSEDFADAAWTRDNATAGNGAAAPDGGVGAQLLAEDTGTGQHRARQIVGASFAADATLAVSCFIKAAGRGYATLQFGAANGFRACFDLTAGALAAGFAGASFGTGTFVSAGIQRFPGGWHRCWIVGKEDPAATLGEAYLNIVRTPAYTEAWTGDGASGVRSWGYQVEAGPFPTSYVATAGAVATRAADLAAIATLAPWFNAAEGTLYAEASILGYNTSVGHIGVSFTNGTNDERLDLGLVRIAGSDPKAILSFQTTSSGSTVLVATDVIAPNAVTRIAGAYKSGDNSVSAQGLPTVTNGLALLPAGINAGRVGRNFGGGVLNGNISRAIYWPKRLSNSLLQGLSR